VTRVVGSVGTDHHPFVRMLEWIRSATEAIDGLDALVQRGATPPLDGLDTVEYVGAAELEALMLEADAVVCHGGPGTISLAVRCGHRPIVIARDPSRGEHVDDHQMRYTARLHAEGQIDMPTDLDGLIALLSVPRARLTPANDERTELAATAKFGELVERLTSGTLPRRTLRERILVRRVP
jgi:UDP-N-acetylglucosamine transferase subunit ALG13